MSSIYIDPPFNTENNDFLYKDSLRHSSWASMMVCRLVAARLQPNGSIVAHIDYHEPKNLRRGDQTWKVRLIEEEFGRLMFDVQDV